MLRLVPQGASTRFGQQLDRRRSHMHSGPRTVWRRRRKKRENQWNHCHVQTHSLLSVREILQLQVCCLLFVACCLLFSWINGLIATPKLILCCLSEKYCSRRFVVCCLLSVVCYCCLLFVVCCLLFVVYFSVESMDSLQHPNSFSEKYYDCKFVVQSNSRDDEHVNKLNSYPPQLILIYFLSGCTLKENCGAERRHNKIDWIWIMLVHFHCLVGRLPKFWLTEETDADGLLQDLDQRALDLKEIFSLWQWLWFGRNGDFFLLEKHNSRCHGEYFQWIKFVPDLFDRSLKTQREIIET